MKTEIKNDTKVYLSEKAAEGVVGVQASACSGRTLKRELQLRASALETFRYKKMETGKMPFLQCGYET